MSLLEFLESGRERFTENRYFPPFSQEFAANQSVQKFLEEATAKLRKNGMLGLTGLSYYRVMSVFVHHGSGLRLRSALVRVCSDLIRSCSARVRLRSVRDRLVGWASTTLSPRSASGLGCGVVQPISGTETRGLSTAKTRGLSTAETHLPKRTPDR